MKDAANNTVQTEQRRLAAIMFTDIVGFSRQMGADEPRMLRLLDVHNQLIQQAVTEHHGHVIKTIGDAFLVDFPSVVHAVQCAQSIQIQLRTHNAEKAKDEQIHVRIGIHLGDVVQRDGDVFGDGVNVASRLQGLAEPDTVCISQGVYKEVEKKLPLGTVVSLGKPKLKNIAERFPVYALLPAPPTGLWQRLQVQRLKFSRRLRPVGFVLVFVSGALVAGLIAVRYLSFLAPNTHHVTRNTQESLPLPDKPSIVVLPFDNMSGDPNQDYFSNGITEVLTSDLSRISSLFVIARNTAFSIGKSRNVQEVGRELGVRYVLEGSVQKASEQVRIVAQLIDTTTGGHLWSQRYDRPLKDIFALQDDIVQKIVTTLKLQLTLQEQGVLVRKHSDNLDAYDTLLRGVEYFYRFTKEGIAQARSLFERAIELDQQYAEAYAWLGFTYQFAWGQGWSTDPQNLQRAFELEQKALSLDDSLPKVHIILGFLYTYQNRYELAVAEAERAIVLAPNDTEGYATLAHVFNVFEQRSPEAVDLMEKAVRLNPRYPSWYSYQLGWAYRMVGRYEEAIAAAKQALLRNPNWLPSHFELSVNYLGLWISQQSQDPQTLDRALEAAQRAIASDAASPGAHLVLSLAYLWKKHYDQALTETEQILALNLPFAGFYTISAGALTYLGQLEKASKSVEKALSLNTGLRPTNFRPLGHTYYLTGRPEEAIAALKRSLIGTPIDLDAHLFLAAVYSELGRDTEAQAEAAEVLRINPKWSLEVWKQRAPYKDPAMLERVFAALRKAGLK